MSLFVLKLLLTPLLIAAATIAARRWGPVAGGWLAGLPLTSGPVSVFLALEQGPQFAAQAAHGTLLGLIAVVVFCVAYARSAGAMTWPGSAALGLATYLVVALILSLPSPGLVAAAVVTLVTIGVALRVVPDQPGVLSGGTSARWDLPIRMIVGGIIVLALTGVAQRLGPTWSGLLSPFPVFACVMAVFTHRLHDAESVQRLLRGVIIGAFAFGSFFVVLALALPRTSLLVAYALATLAALTVHALTLVTLVLDPATRPQATSIS